MKAKKILFQGDSITDAGRNRDNPNSLGQGYPLITAGLLGEEFPDRGYTFINKGISGNRVVDLFARWQEEAINISPDLISILIGVNDVWHEISRQCGVEAEKFEKVYTDIIEETKKKLPKTTIILMEPFVLQGSATSEKWDVFKSETVKRQEVVARIAKKYNLTFVCLQKMFDESCKDVPSSYWLADGVHPTPSGHALIAKQWIRTVCK